ncbi:hypothetical protein UlMin_037055 [Ulmus minor]
MVKVKRGINELRTTIGPQTERSSQYYTDAYLGRYLEARNWNLNKSKEMLEETIKWRSTYKLAHEGETRKLYRANFHDQQGISVLILRPTKQLSLILMLLKKLYNTSSLDNQMQYLVYLLENAIFNLPEDQKQMAWLIDFTGWMLSTSVPAKSAQETIHILQNHYLERLDVAFLYNPPRIFEAFWKIVKYFLDYMCKFFLIICILDLFVLCHTRVYGGPTRIRTDATWSFYREVLGCDELDLLLAMSYHFFFGLNEIGHSMLHFQLFNATDIFT